MKHVTQVTAVILTVIMLMSAVSLTVFAYIDHRAVYDAALEYINSLGTPAVGSVGGEWMVIDLTRSGYPCPDGYYENVVEYVNAKINDKEQLHRSKGTDNSRVILALTSAGYDVTDVDGHNLLMGLTDMTYVKKQGINGPIWALIAFDCNNYDIPLNPDSAEQVTREGLIVSVLDKQLEDGGWALSGKNADPDMTGMAIQSLAGYYDTDNRVKEAVDRALACLCDIQKEDGGYGSIDGICSESCAQVIVALTSLGIDPETDSRFVKNGSSVLDAMCGFAVEGGGFAHNPNGAVNGMATEQATYALASYFRFLEGKSALYDMSDVFEISDDGIDTDDVTGDQTDEVLDDSTGDETTVVPDDSTENETTAVPDDSTSEETAEVADDSRDSDTADMQENGIGNDAPIGSDNDGNEDVSDKGVNDSNTKPNNSTNPDAPTDSDGNRDSKPVNGTDTKPGGASDGKSTDKTNTKPSGNSNNKNTGSVGSTAANGNVSSVNEEDIPQTSDKGIILIFLAASVSVTLIYCLSVKKCRKYRT